MQIEYAFVKLYDGLYEDELREKLGTYFDLAVNYCAMRGQDAAEILVASGLAHQLEIQNPGFVAGRSGVELLQWAREACGMAGSVPNPERAPLSADYWTGYMLALFQIRSGLTYAQVFSRASYADLREMNSWCQDKPEDGVVAEIHALLARQPQVCALRRIRNAAGLTQGQLAQRAGISMRAIQQYEEGKKDINRAAAISVRKLALVLGCNTDDLLEPMAV